ncbi:MAG: exodeoxyribonuclease VII small subunit [Bacteroidetes bacterium]|jgi:exodeoxyribonuclease VII small subunit|nr:exodeoxyribonuclease VII small subunit [Bacteroidota bacterium]
MAKKAISYTEAVREIEEILGKMENEELDVDDLSVKVKRVSELIEICRSKLYKTEEDVEKILKDMGGENKAENNDE